MFPASVIDVSLFIAHLSATCKSSLLQLFNLVIVPLNGYTNQMGNTFLKSLIEGAKRYTNQMGNTFLKSLIEGAKREHAKPVSKKAPVSSDALEECCLAHQSCDTLLVRRDISMALLMFSGFLRYSEIAQLNIRDVTIFDSHLSLTIRKSKIDQYRKGNEVVIDRSKKVTCPVHNLERYMRVASIILDHSTHYLFRPIVHAQTGGNRVFDSFLN